MIQRSISKLNFVKSHDPMPTVEVQAESLENQGLLLNGIISSALARYAANNPTSKATIYMYGTMSVNFHTAGWSEFLIVAGNQKILKVLYDTFSRLPQVQSRFSDYIAPNQGIQAFHVEDGLLWRPEDAITWYADSPEGEEKEQAPAETPLDTDDIGEDDANDWGDRIVEAEPEPEDDKDDKDDKDDDVQPTGRTPEQPARYRAARSNARVASIRQTVEQVFGLPEGSVALCGPDGRALRGDAFIKTLRRRWADA